MDCVWNFKAFHTVSVSPLLEVHLKGSSAPVTKVSTDFALVFDTQPMKLVEPVGDRLPVPS